MEEVKCCVEERKTIVSIIQRNTKIINEISGTATRILDLLTSNKATENTNKEPNCVFTELENQNLNLIKINEMLIEIERTLN